MAGIEFKSSPVFAAIWKALNKKNAGNSHYYKLIVEEGGSRSTKTWSNFQALFLYLFENPLSSVTVLRDTQKSCRDIVEKDWKQWLSDPMVRKKEYDDGNITVEQFDKFLQTENLKQYLIENKTNHTWTFKHNGNVIWFTGLDDENLAMGMTQTICWINEPYSFQYDVYKQLAMRSKVIIFDWNPKQNHWVENEKAKETTFVHYSTFKDNPFIIPETKMQILSYQPIHRAEAVELGLITKEKVFSYDFESNPFQLTDKQIRELKRCIYNEKTGSASEYDWDVYGLGKKSEKPNKIYKGWKPITLEEYNSIDEREYFGLDYGWAKPTAFLSVKYRDGVFYVRPRLYQPMNSMKDKSGVQIPLGEKLIEKGFPSGNVTYGWADSSDKEAGSDISMTNSIRENYQLNLVPTSKPTYKERWAFFSACKVRYVVDKRNENEYKTVYAPFEFECENYELEYINGEPTGKPIKKNDHYINAFEYCGWGMKGYLNIRV